MRKLSFLALLLTIGCAGSASSTAGSHATPAGVSDSSSDSHRSSGPSLPSCEDGSCFACGDTVCLRGYYCEKIGATSGCAWNGPCAKRANCACLASVAGADSSCSCEERDGHAF
ncbi:MAG TPA: hypothetical protein PLV85_25235, partial [Polyangiaceae bacterium]|nr:hypothetical protein [Polyangiaceae bacterium]